MHAIRKGLPRKAGSTERGEGVVARHPHSIPYPIVSDLENGAIMYLAREGHQEDNHPTDPPRGEPSLGLECAALAGLATLTRKH